MKIYVNVTKEDVKKGMPFMHTYDRDPIARATRRALQNHGLSNAFIQVVWGGEIDINGVTHRPTGLKRMPFLPYGMNTERKHRRYLRRPRKFNFEYKG